jgi:hypothetical protein
MPISKSSRALVATATLALLAGCSGGAVNSPNPSVGGQSAFHGVQSVNHNGFRADTLMVQPNIAKMITGGTPHWAVLPAKGDFKGIAWVSDSGTNEVYQVTPAGKITSMGSGWSEPQGLNTDSKGNVYVADTANSRVVVLNGKTGKAVTILTDAGQYPVGVAINDKGVIAVSNIISTSDGDGSVSIYSSLKATSPTGSCTGLLSRDYFIGMDNESNIYLDGDDASTGAIDVGTCTTAGGTISNTGIVTSSYIFPGGVNVYSKIATDDKKAKETLGVGDQSAFEVHLYALPKYTVGAVVDLGGGSDEVGYSIDEKQNVAGAADAGLAEANFWAWPKGGSAPASSITGFSEPIGITFVKTGVE